MNRRLVIFLVMLGLIIFITLMFLLFSGPHMRYQPSVHTYQTILPDQPEGIVPFNHRDFDPASIKLDNFSSADLSRGKVYYEYYCIFCHGDDGRGNGEVGRSYFPKPADLTTDSILKFSPARLYSASFRGTGHSPVLERVVPYPHRQYILLYVRHGLR